MNDPVLFRRTLPHGPTIRIRRATSDGEVPVVVVLEMDRRASNGARSGSAGVEPALPALMQCEAPTLDEALARLSVHASDDRRVVQLMRDRGLR